MLAVRKHPWVLKVVQSTVRWRTYSNEKQGPEPLLHLLLRLPGFVQFPQQLLRYVD